MNFAFKSYSDIENSYNEKVITQIREHKFDDEQILWCATTKIDGSNFQCTIDADDNFVVGTRTRFLDKYTEFQGYERAVQSQKIESKLRYMKKYLQESFELVKDKQFALRVYGELCGGMYLHPDVEKVKGVGKIQGRISYHPDIVWIPFDIDIIDTENNIIHVFNVTSVYNLCSRVNLVSVPILAVGTFDEMLKYPNDFNDTTGHDLFNLPYIENNIAEGVVIRPLNSLRFGNGSRVIIKNKNDKFKERVSKAPKEPKEVIPMNELELKWYEIYREFITESRVMSVISKIGQINSKQFGMILGKYLEDLNNDFDKEYKEEFKSLCDTHTADEFNPSKIRKEIAKEAAEIIRPIFLKFL